MIEHLLRHATQRCYLPTKLDILYLKSGHSKTGPMRSISDLIIELKAQGINDSSVLNAMEAVPREHFVSQNHQGTALENTALPIECHQTISQPYIVALMTAQLMLHPHPQKILEIGTGSGYQTAILAKLFKQIYTIERIQQLHQSAKTRLEQLAIDNVHYQLADGHLGWPEYAPYDGIIVTACAETVPTALIDQLSPNGGIMVIPVGKQAGVQKLKRIVKQNERLKEDTIEWVAFVPMQSGTS